MKMHPLLAASLVACVPMTANAVNTSKHILGGKQDGASLPYLVKGPYTLKWIFTPESKKHGVFSVFVYDEAGRCLGSTDGEFEGKLEIPAGGTHKVKVIATDGRFDVWYVDK